MECMQEEEKERRRGEEEEERLSSQTLSFAVSLKVGCGGSPRDRSFDGSEVLLILLMIVMIIDRLTDLASILLYSLATWRFYRRVWPLRVPHSVVYFRLFMPRHRLVMSSITSAPVDLARVGVCTGT